MSITFRAAITTTVIGFRVECFHCQHLFAALAPSEYEQAWAGLDDRVCPTHGDGWGTVEPVEDGDPGPMVNLSNTNAAALFRALGMDVELTGGGSVPAVELVERLAFLAARDDEGAPSIEYQADGGSVMMECGRRAGYFADVPDRLAPVIEAAVAADVDVVWG